MSGTKNRYRFTVVSATRIGPSWGSKFKCLLTCGHTVEATMHRDAPPKTCKCPTCEQKGAK